MEKLLTLDKKTEKIIIDFLHPFSTPAFGEKEEIGILPTRSIGNISEKVKNIVLNEIESANPNKYSVKSTKIFVLIRLE